ncbi:MAG: tRNA (adenosine(37)-N6)-threonylcarbamoyltransferase complex dimerization subunit type 1 TsaB [Clostridia bacterium]|nr:tRNA (adenosine(37)-N6)-threonylcarbamoyltransferase complex dimerization subunit type 1 TsaB [Clostridia bacterium]
MLTLGISTSSKNPSAAVMRDGDVISFRIDESGRSHSAVLMSLIEGALKDAAAAPSELDLIAVDIGPGSFTGVRIGVSCANAMAFALGIKVVPVCSLAAIRNLVPEDSVVCSLIDCRNGNCYAALYRDVECIMEPSAAVIAEVLPSDGASIVGDCCGRQDHPNARLVLAEANKGMIEALPEAVPMYLRPSQAERMRTEK